uniref:Phosphoglycerate mutase-like protein n=1 Tax=Alexandrium monilatum TaxID=311494 RepID=A0A7S4Q743_9DINO|mmetsp:Transcript_96246/g.305384  ORF Transcript_96246/g.305384 Transcript_96246/m.305384 type:complete len:311 (+) Transcript_96246:41-973(+)
MPASFKASHVSPMRGGPAPVVKTLYLVRHGEAVHNIEEHRAKRRAAAEAEALGHVEGGEAHKAMVEAARKAALRCEHLRDPSLSSTGANQTLTAKDELKALTQCDIGLPDPAVVLVSPLQRTLETAALLFPDHPRVHVCEDLRERRTLLPCDERKPAQHLARQSDFSNMDFASLLDVDSELEASAVEAQAEDAAKLRVRTTRLVEALRTVDDSVLCLITHKAFLRELERGPLGQKDAKEFSNCEVRAYDVALMSDGSLVAELLHSAEAPWSGAAEGGFSRTISVESVVKAHRRESFDLGPCPALEVYSVF